MFLFPVRNRHVHAVPVSFPSDNGVFVVQLGPTLCGWDRASPAGATAPNLGEHLCWNTRSRPYCLRPLSLMCAFSTSAAEHCWERQQLDAHWEAYFWGNVSVWHLRYEKHTHFIYNKALKLVTSVNRLQITFQNHFEYHGWCKLGLHRASLCWMFEECFFKLRHFP